MDDFGQFYGARKDAVFRAVLVAVGDRVAAEDAVAETFARAYARWSRVRQHPNPTAWVLRTALNAQRSWWRRARREVAGATPEPQRPTTAGRHVECRRQAAPGHDHGDGRWPALCRHRRAAAEVGTCRRSGSP